ncbi:MAG: hypothetical protein Q4C85_08490 [Actinomyces sp.]|uniref:hypothetical protein n=1 Tax=Actinomyces sp. TaxID=29317 RepID=UPI0026DAE3BB|nr:hypothetical protein [Actinomyces sp.]MDO4243775.1 hypothetical protein [Actinomyces sp.]
MSTQDTGQDATATVGDTLEWVVPRAVLAAGILYSTRLWPRTTVQRRGNTVIVDTVTGRWLTIECGPGWADVEAGYDDACGLRHVELGRAASSDELAGIIADWLYRLGVKA